MDAPQLSDPPAIEAVSEWFKKEWPEATQYPGISQCRDLRLCLKTVVESELGRARAMNPAKSEALNAKREALKTARRMLRSVPHLWRRPKSTESRSPTLPLIFDGGDSGSAAGFLASRHDRHIGDSREVYRD
jgi:hypothetical protein